MPGFAFSAGSVRPAPRTMGLTRALAAALAGLALAGCTAGVKKDAAEDVRAFLAAAETGHEEAFEARIDRKAVRADLKAQLLKLPEVRALEDQLGDQTGDVAVDRMISPQAFKLVRSGEGKDLPIAPTAEEVQPLLKVIDRRHVCVHDLQVADRCLLTFEKQGRRWKLVGMHASDLTVQIPFQDPAAAGAETPDPAGAAETD